MEKQESKEENLKEWYMRSAKIYSELRKKHPNKYTHSKCDTPDEVLHNAMINLWKLTDWANDRDESKAKIAKLILNASCQIKNFKEAGNLYLD